MSDFNRGFHSAFEGMVRDWENLSWPQFDLGIILEFIGFMTAHMLIVIPIFAIILGILWCIFKFGVFWENRREAA